MRHYLRAIALVGVATIASRESFSQGVRSPTFPRGARGTVATQSDSVQIALSALVTGPVAAEWTGSDLYFNWPRQLHPALDCASPSADDASDSSRTLQAVFTPTRFDPGSSDHDRTIEVGIVNAAAPGSTAFVVGRYLRVWSRTSTAWSVAAFCFQRYKRNVSTAGPPGDIGPLRLP